jgi:hypothetical protein
MTKVVWSRTARAAIAAMAFGSVSCGDLTRQGQSPAYLIVQTLEAAQGHAPDEFFGALSSDVFTVIEDVPGVFPDLGRVSFVLALKDPGPPGSPTAPSRNNAITVNRYRVTFIRADGRNTPGVDVPFPFDGAFTVTVSDEATVGFTLVRLTAKEEAPLAALRVSPVIIGTIAEITFYGHDQTGREVIATGRIGVSFGNFADPQ